MKFNGKEIKSVFFNGIEQSSVVMNRKTVWGKGVSPIGYPYSFGVLSDIHISATTGEETQSQSDFTRALNYYSNADVKMVCSSGDLTDNGTDSEFEAYKSIRDASGLPMFEVTGNHEAASVRTYKSDLADENCIAYKFYDLVGRDFCYYLKGDKYKARRFNFVDGAISYDDVETNSNVTIPDGDVFIFVSILGDRNNGLFFTEELQWLKNVLEENRNNRCFIFEHCRAERLVYDSATSSYTEDMYATKVSGNYTGFYRKPLWGDATNNYHSKNAIIFESLMAHYTNCIWFHGHTHQSSHWAVDLGEDVALVDTFFGDHYNRYNIESSVDNVKKTYSVHISSCAEPRNASGKIPSGSEGCIITANVDSMIIKYIDFTTSEIVKEYNISTTRNIIQANSFVDPTETIS